ncbi:protein D3-like [Diorhabda carinulata]|uniref:protein D3-like n=1 Tax=Diorhabda carinulata TaxID=1163345 RepID=UPI0025A120AF|nr:protein D3-like [Diorhabda carinulata]
MEKEDIVPTIIDTVPAEILEVTFPNGLKVELGNELTPTQVKDEPYIKWNTDSCTLYTVVMIDPDAPSRQNQSSGQVLHWLVGNVGGNDIKSGQLIAKYISSAPREKTGLHRYIYLIYKQHGFIDYSELEISCLNHRLKWNVRNFAKKYNLGQPIAGNFYQAQYDEYVPIIHSRIRK